MTAPAYLLRLRFALPFAIPFLPMQHVSAAPPVAMDDVAIIRTVQKAVVIDSVLANDSDPDGDALTISSVSKPLRGKAVLEGNSIRYDPNSTFRGEDVFSYVVRDTEGNEVTAQVTVRNPFLLGSGRYAGPIAGDSAEFATTGYMTLQLGGGGRFTCTVKFAGSLHRFRGSFSDDGAFQRTLRSDRSIRPLTMQFPMGLGGESDEAISGTIAGIPFTIPRSPYRRDDPFAHSGYYTIALPPMDPADRSLPGGHGFGVLRISNIGAATITGKLGDGSNWTSSTVITPAGQLPVYGRLYRSRGSILGNLDFTGSGVATVLSGSLQWEKLRIPGHAYYRSGFKTMTNVMGSMYSSPEPGQFPFAVMAGVRNVTFFAAGDGLKNEKLEFGTLGVRPAAGAYAVAIENATKIRANCTIDAKRGLVRGAFRVQLTGGRRQFRGVILQQQAMAAGVFRGLHTSGRIEIRPARDQGPQ